MIKSIKNSDNHEISFLKCLSWLVCCFYAKKLSVTSFELENRKSRSKRKGKKVEEEEKEEKRTHARTHTKFSLI
jgi:hypothetical protein